MCFRLSIFPFLLFLLLPALTTVVAEPLPNPYCPVLPDEKATAEFKSTHEGKDVFFCCRDCVRDFEADPAAYLADLPQFAGGDRSPFQQRVDAVWNAGAAYAGLTLGGIALLFLGILRLAGRKSAFIRTLTSRKVIAGVVVAAIAGEAVNGHLRRGETASELRDLELENWVHFATFHDYGHPPVPSKPDKPPRLAATFYRGNDERNPALFNGGYYRTSTFDISLTGGDGAPKLHGDQAAAGDLFLKIVIRRAPGTADYFWQPDKMAKMYATQSAEKFQGREEPVADAVFLTTIEPEQVWEIRYPLANFYKAVTERCDGIVYLCEQRFDEEDDLIGGRFHFAFQFSLDLGGGVLRPDSDLWMGALYRSRIVPVWHIPENEWLSADPIPVIEGHHDTSDPELLGITADKEDKN